MASFGPSRTRGAVSAGGYNANQGVQAAWARSNGLATWSDSLTTGVWLHLTMLRAAARMYHDDVLVRDRGTAVWN